MKKDKVSSYITEEDQLAAVSQCGIMIKYIENPTEKVQLAAVMQDKESFVYIENPTEKVVNFAKNRKDNKLFGNSILTKVYKIYKLFHG